MLIPNAGCRTTKGRKILRLVGASYYYLLAFKQETAKELLVAMPESALERKVASLLDFSSPVLPSAMKIFQPTACKISSLGALKCAF